jgi:hypothetical protein
MPSTVRIYIYTSYLPVLNGYTINFMFAQKGLRIKMDFPAALFVALLRRHKTILINDEPTKDQYQRQHQ